MEGRAAPPPARHSRQDELAHALDDSLSSSGSSSGELEPAATAWQAPSPMRGRPLSSPAQLSERPVSVMEVVDMSIQALEEKVHVVEERAAQLSHSRRPQRPPSPSRARGSPAAPPEGEWDASRLARELPAVEARRAQHMGKLHHRIDSALRHVDGLSAHLDDLQRPAPPPLPSGAFGAGSGLYDEAAPEAHESARFRRPATSPPRTRQRPEPIGRTASSKRASVGILDSHWLSGGVRGHQGSVSRAEQLLLRLQDSEWGGAAASEPDQSGVVAELNRAEQIQAELVERLMVANSASGTPRPAIFCGCHTPTRAHARARR